MSKSEFDIGYYILITKGRSSGRIGQVVKKMDESGCLDVVFDRPILTHSGEIEFASIPEEYMVAVTGIPDTEVEK